MSGLSTPDRAVAWNAGGTALIVALALNLATLVVAKIVGVEMAVRPSGAAAAMEINGWLVFATTVVPLLVASVLLYLTRQHRPRAWQVLAMVGLAIGVLTVAMPLSATATAGTKVALTLMHLATGIVWFVVVRRAATEAAPESS